MWSEIDKRQNISKEMVQNAQECSFTKYNMEKLIISFKHTD